MAGLGGEIGGERRIIIVDTYPAACGMRVRWVGEILNSGTYTWEGMLLQVKHMNNGIGIFETLGDRWEDRWVDWLCCEAAFGRLEQSTLVHERILSWSFLIYHWFSFACLLHPAMHTSLSVQCRSLKINDESNQVPNISGWIICFCCLTKVAKSLERLLEFSRNIDLVSTPIQHWNFTRT